MNLISRLKENEFWSSVFTLSSGTAIAQIIALLITPVLTRIYSPEDFGAYGLYFSYVMIMSVIICLRYEMAIILPKDDEERINILALCCLVAFSITFFSFFVIFFWNNEITSFIKKKGFEIHLFWLPISVLIVGLFQCVNFWANKKKKYTQLSISRIYRSSVFSGFGVLFGFSSFKKSGLIIADITSQFISLIYLLSKVWSEIKINFSKINWRKIVGLSKRYKNFPKYQVSSGLLEKIAGNSPIILLAFFFTSVEAGLFAFAMKIISAPVALISTAIGDVFREKASTIYEEDGHCRKIYLSTLKKLIFIAVPGFIVVFILIYLFFVPIFGSEWADAGKYSQIMCVMFFFQFITSPLSSMFIISEKQHVDMIIHIFLVLFLFLSFWAGKYFFDDAMFAITFFTIIYCVKYIVEFIFSYQFSKGIKL
jgi:O-antigen/teichoic acid export membrane protein